eukprot:1161693-Pelagomonas_calceolata.AAC.5
MSYMANNRRKVHQEVFLELRDISMEELLENRAGAMDKGIIKVYTGSEPIKLDGFYPALAQHTP